MDAKTIGLLTLGMGLLDNKGGNFGQAIAGPGLLGMHAYQDALMREQAQRRADLVSTQIERQMADEDKVRQWRSRLQSPQQMAVQQALSGGGGPTVANAAKMPAVNPVHQILFEGMQAGAVPVSEYIGAMQPKAADSPFAKINPSEYTPESVRRFTQTGNPADLVAVAAQPKLPEGMRMGPNGPEWIPGYLDGRRSVSAAGAPRQTVSVSTERSYAGTVADGLAKDDVDAITAARSAPERIRAARNVKEILTTQQPITGTLAEQRLAVNKALATAGIISEDSAAATEALAASLASQALAAIKTSGLGAGSGFSNADRDFLERASAGKIDMTPGALLRIADLNEKAAMRSIEKGNAVMESLRNNPNFGSVRDRMTPVQIPDQVRLPTPAEIEAEMRRRGIK